MSHGTLNGVVVFRRNAEGVRPGLLAYGPLGFVFARKWKQSAFHYESWAVMTLFCLLFLPFCRLKDAFS